MSDYDGGHRRHGRIREPEYVETEETFIQRGPGTGTRDLVLRQRDDYDRRGSYRDYDEPPRRARSSHYHGRDYDEYDEYDYDRPRRRRSGYEDDYDYYSDDYERAPRRERRKSKAGEILEDLGLGGVAAAVTKTIGGRSRSRSRRRRGSGYEEDEESRDGFRRSRSHDARKKWQQAAKAAVITGVIEAVRSRNEPGGWTGEKGQRIATAALASAGVDGFLDRDPDHKSKRHIVESVVAGLGVNRLANGPREGSSSRGRSRSRSRSVVDRLRSRSRSILGGRSRSRSQSRGRGRSSSRIKEVAALGGAAAVGKAIWDRVRSKSRGRLRRDASVSSDDSYVPSRRQRYQPGPPMDRGPPGGAEFDRGQPAEAGPEGDIVNRPRDRSRDSGSSEDTDDLKEKYKKTRGKELLTAALASVATIHAAHGVYSSMVASEKRHQKVLEGEMSPETARKLKSKNMLQDAAAVGIAALSLKSAFSEWKEMTEQRKEKHELYTRRRKRIKARERRERELRLAGGYGGYGGYGSPGGAGNDFYRGSGAPTYGDQNPYNSYSNIPPPPVGAPPNRYA